MDTYANLICEQYTSRPVPEILEYYREHGDLIKRSERKIRTIGMYYHGLHMGGVEKVITLLIPIWQQAGYQVVMLTQEEPASADLALPEETVRVVLPKDVQGFDKRLNAFEDALLTYGIDLVVYNEWGDYKTFHEMLLVKRHHIPFILYTHGAFSKIYAFLHDYSIHSHEIFGLCDKVLTLSEINRQYYELCGCDSLLVQNPIEEKLKGTVPEYSGESCHDVVWIGRFSEEKRPLDAIRVMQYVCMQVPDAMLHFVGTGTEAMVGRARALSRELGIERNVIFCGQQSDVSRFYKEAAVVLMTSEAEGYPNVIIEAKAYGKVLAMYALPYLTMTKSGLGLRTVRVGDVKGLAAEIVTVLTDADLRRKLEQESLQSFAEFRDYNQAELWNGIVKEMEQADVCNTLCATGDGPLMISMLLDDVNIAYKRGQKAMEAYPDFRIGHAVLKIPRMIKHLLKL